MKVIRKKPSSPFLQLWRNLRPLKLADDVPVMSNLRGNVTADILIMAPPPTETDYENGVPLSGPASLILHELIEEETGLDTNIDCLVMSCSRYGKKANKASTEDIRLLVEKAASLNLFKFYICVGDEAFKYFFGRGIKASPSVFGNIMYVPEVKWKPLFALPPLDGLFVQMTGNRRDDNRLKDWNEKTVLRFREQLKRLKTEVDKCLGHLKG